MRCPHTTVVNGGTSLSKGWNLLDRFSEDLDILVRSEADWGKAKRDTRLKTLRDTIGGSKGFDLDPEDRRTRAETGISRRAVFRYESVVSDVPGLGRNVLFEAGYRGLADAAVKRPIRLMVAEYAKDKGQQNLAEDLHDFEIELQGLPRTFVEKLFAIHAAYPCGTQYQARGKRVVPARPAVWNRYERASKDPTGRQCRWA
jgi:hypothetical protein